MPNYNDTPLPTDPINQTQAPIRTNFASIRSVIAVNHVDITDPADFGKHKFVTFPVQAASPAIVYPDIGLFSKLYPTTGINELFFINSGNIVPEVPFTAADYSNLGWTYLPSGLLLQWGPIAAANNTPVLFARNFTAVPFSVVVSPTAPAVSGALGASNFQVGQFTVTSQNAVACNGSFFAIGY